MSDAPTPPVPIAPTGAARRKQLRQQRRAERLRQLWRLFVFSGITAGLGYVLLRQGWSLREPSQVEVTGSALVRRDQVIRSAGLRFPQPLLTLRPKQLAAELAAALPVEQVKVTRLMLPPRLRVELVDREVVARAERRTTHGPEQGYVDRLGSWVPMQPGLTIRVKGDDDLRVVGWHERHRAALATVLASRSSLGPDLREVRFEPDGSLWLVSDRLGRVRLGPVDGLLERRLEVVRHLASTLPIQLRGRRPQVIDLSDPDQPELSLPGVGRPSFDGGPAGAVAPRGGQ